MPTSQDIEWTRGQTETWVLSIFQADDSPDDLTDAESVELEVKKFDGSADPAFLHLDSLGNGIVIRSQVDPNVGICDVTVSVEQTFSLAAGLWRYDVFVNRMDGTRRRAMLGRLTVREVVNFP